MENNLHNSNIFRTFEAWIGGSCKPSEKGNPTAFPRFNNLSEKTKIVGDMLRFEDLPEINSERWLSLEDLPGEEWRDVEGYRGIVQISCYGRLKKKEYVWYNPSIDSYVTHKEKILRIQNTGGGYRQIRLCIFGKEKYYNIHRLVASAFILNPNKFPIVNHIDENPSNNCVYNLEWCTVKHNINWGNARKKMMDAMERQGRTRAVVLYDYEGGIIEEYVSMGEAGRKNNLRESDIQSCCSGKTATAKGFHFRFKGEHYEKRNLKNYKMLFKLIQSDGNHVVCDNYREFCSILNISTGVIDALKRGKSKYSKQLKDKHIVIEERNGDIVEIRNGVIVNKKTK